MNLKTAFKDQTKESVISDIEQGPLREAFEVTLAHSEHAQQVDAALIEAGRTIADQVDANVAHGTALEINRALSHLPELVKILRELLATPASRLAAESKPKQDAGTLERLRAAASSGGKSPKRAA